MQDRITAVDRYIDQNLDGWISELTELCRIPSVSARHEGIEQCAELVAGMLEKRGFDVRVLPSDGHPVVLAHRHGAGDRTMLLYNHYDVQPPEPLELWESPPYEATLRDGRIFGRGAKDDKGELMARLAAVDALLAAGGEVPARLTWLVEGEEEVGSPNLPSFVSRHAEELRCDGAIWEEGGIDGQGRPQVVLGVRGLLYVELRVRASSRDGHSGEANLIPNAAWRLAWALGTLKDTAERILIPGFYDGMKPISARQRALLARLPYRDDELKESYGLGSLVLGRAGLDAVSARFEPTCNIAGLTSGYQGVGAKTVIPAVASAKVDFRLLPGQDPDDLASKLRSHLDGQGFADVEIEVLSAERAGLVDPDDPLVELTRECALEVYGRAADVVPMAGGTTPMYLFTDEGVPVVAPGVGFGASNLAHSPNENMRLQDFRNAARHIARLLTRFGAASAPSDK